MTLAQTSKAREKIFHGITVGRRSGLSVFPLKLSTLTFETGSVTGLGFFNESGCLVSPRDLPASASAVLGLWRAPTLLLFFMGSED